MGLENESNVRKNYINIVDGKFAIRVKPETPNAVARENKLKVVVHELLYDKLSKVNIVKIQKEEHKDYGFSWEISLREADESFILNLPYSGRATNGLFHRLPNIDLAKPVTLNVYKIADDNDSTKFKTFLTVSQDDKKVEPFYTKLNPNGLPPMEEITVKGKQVWDDTKQMAFIEQYLNEKVVPELTKLYPSVKPEAHADSGPDVNPEDVDDLPF